MIEAMIGVIVGFILSETSQIVKSKLNRRTLKASLENELDSIIRMLPQVADTLDLAEKEYKSGRILPTSVTAFPKHIYNKIITESPEILQNEERDKLHLCHERLKIVHTGMKSLEKRHLNISTTKSNQIAIQATLTSITDIKQSLFDTRKLIQSLVNH